MILRRKILVVDDNKINRQLLERMLSGEYEVFEAQNGQEAMEVMERIHDDISAVLLDLAMPVMDGYEVLSKMRTDSKLANIPVIVTTSSTEDGAEVKALSLGANDFIVKPYTPTVIKHRLWNTINLRENAAFVNSMQRDKLTGLYNRETFFAKAEKMISLHEPGYYVMTCFDIDNFKVINDQYGTAKGDEVLKHVADTFRHGFEPIGGVCARIMADSFAVLYPHSFVDSEKIMEIRRAAAQVSGLTQPIAFSIGRYIVNDRSLSVSAMYDRASLAEASVKARFDVQVAEYSESMRDELLHEQKIINEMNSALESGQFEVWLQPQYNHSSGALIGAEALVRWRHPDKGIIAPDDFIPIFERNGFIYDMDKYIWEQTAILLRKWIDERRSPLPVSVNVSRYDVFHADFYETITGLVEKYTIPIDLLRLEITESAFAKSTQQIMDMVKRLIDYGFIIEIDDFGSGYSSLNTLKDIPANVLKLDMRFLENNENSMRGGNILQSIVRMAKWLGMLVIAEGVETKIQADYLRSIGCVYIQGYLYAKPMQVDEYEELAARSGKEQEMSVLETVETLDNDAFWDPNSMETLIFNSYVGGACIFEYNNGSIEILRINDKYAQELGGGNLSMEDALAIDIVAYMDESDAATIFGCVQNAIKTGAESTCEVRMLELPGNSGYTYIRTTMRVIARAGAHMLFYCSIINMTAQREAEHKERALANQMQVIMNNVNGGVSAVTIDDEYMVRFVFANDQYYSMLGYTREQFHAELPNAFNVLHPDDIELIQEKVSRVLQTRQSDFYEYRCIKRGGGIIYVRCNASITSIEGVGDTVLLSVITDITAQRNAEQKEQEVSDQLQAILQNIQGGISAATLIGGTVDYIFVNDGYYSMYGYTREQFERELPRGIVDLIHPDDLQMVLDTASQAQEADQAFQIEYRTYNRDGQPMWVQSNGSICHMEHYDLPVQLAVTNDITREKKAELQILQSAEQLRFLNETARDLLVQEDVNSGINHVLLKILGYFEGNRAYVVELDYESEISNNTYEVCAPQVSCEIDNLQGIPFDVTQSWFMALEQEGFVFIEDVDALDESRDKEKHILREQGIRSMVAVPLRKDDRIIGFVGVDDPRRNQSHVGHLQAIGDYIAVMLTRRDLNAKIVSDNKTLMGLMNDTPGGFVRMQSLPDGSIIPLYINDGFCKLVGLTSDEITENYKESALWGVHPDDLPMVQAAVAELLATGETRSDRFRLLHGEGNYIWLMFFARMTKDESGKVFYNVYYTDISEQEKQELSFREMLPIALKTMLSSSSDMSFVKDKNLTYICCSRAFAKMVGLQNEEDIVGKTDYDVFEQELAEKYRADDRKLMESGQSLVDYVEHMPSEDGVSRYSSTSKYLLHDSSGNVIGIYGNGRDITQNLAAYAQLKLLTDSIPGGLAIYELSPPDNIRILYLSNGFYTITGYTKDEYHALAKADFFCLVYEEDIAVIREQIDSVLQGATSFSLVYRERCKDGGYLWFNMRGTVSERRGDTVIVSAVKFDVTEQMTAGESLRMREEEYRLAIAHSGKLIYRYWHADQSVDMPPNTAELLGMPSRMGNVPESLIREGAVAPESTDAYIEFYRAMQRGDKTGSMTILRRISDGSYRWFMTRFSTVYNDTGAPVSAIVMLEDVTAEHDKRSEAEANRESELVWQLVAQHSDRQIYRYDIATKTVAYNNMDMHAACEAETIVLDVDTPPSIIKAWTVLPESLDDYRQVFRDISDARSNGGARLHMCDNYETPHWVDLKYSLIYSDDDTPKSAVISLLDITESHEKELAYNRYLQTIDESALSEGVLIYFEEDITTDTVEKQGGAILPFVLSPVTYSRAEIIEYIAQKYIFKQDQDKCRDFFDRERLIKVFSHGTHSLSADWGITFPNGNLGYVRSELQMVQDPYSGHIKAYTILRDITSEKRAALAVQRLAETDGATGLYNKATTETLIRQRLAQNSGLACALLIVDLDNLKIINDTGGHNQGDEAIRSIADLLSSEFRHTDIVGRIGGDEFAVFIDGMGNEARLRSVLKTLMRKMSMIRLGENQNVNLYGSIGIATGTAGEQTYEELFKKADKALYHVKHNRKNDFAFYAPDMEYTQQKRP